MNQFVVDSSIAVKWYLNEEFTDASLKILDPRNEMHVPNIFFLEIASILCKKFRRKEISNQEFEKVWNAMNDLPFFVHSFEDLLEPAIQISTQTGTSIYDCIYLAISLIGDSVTVTADRRFFDCIRKSRYSKQIIWINDLDL